MKVMAIFVEPYDCTVCPCSEINNTQRFGSFCRLNGEVLHTTDRPHWCPLKEVKEDGD